MAGRHNLRSLRGPSPPSQSPIPRTDGGVRPSSTWGSGGAELFLRGLEDAAGKGQPGEHPQPPLAFPIARPEAPGLFLALPRPVLGPHHLLPPRSPSPCGPASVMPTSPFPFHPKVPLGEHRRQPGSQGNLPPSSSSSSSRTPLCHLRAVPVSLFSPTNTGPGEGGKGPAPAPAPDVAAPPCPPVPTGPMLPHVPPHPQAPAGRSSPPANPRRLFFSSFQSLVSGKHKSHINLLTFCPRRCLIQD